MGPVKYILASEINAGAQPEKLRERRGDGVPYEVFP
jgi:hypothetical protein